MKKVQFITTIIIAMAMNLSYVVATENSEKKTTHQKMAELINQVFFTMPTEDLMNKENELITIHFKVDKDNKFKLLKVDGNNKDLVRYSTIVLTKQEIVFDNSIEPKVYELPVKFVNLLH